MNEYLAHSPDLASADAYDAPTELISACLGGEERAFVSVYNQYAQVIYRLCFTLLGNEQDAEEVLQDSFEYAFRKLARYDDRKASFKTWLYQIAVSRCRNKRRRKWLPTLPLGHLPEEDLLDRNAPAPDDAPELTEKQVIVWEAIRGLSPKLRETAVLRYFEGLTYAEIGAVLSVPPKTAESRMRLAHKQLKNLLLEDQRWTG